MGTLHSIRSDCSGLYSAWSWKPWRMEKAQPMFSLNYFYSLHWGKKNHYEKKKEVNERKEVNFLLISATFSIVWPSYFSLWTWWSNHVVMLFGLCYVGVQTRITDITPCGLKFLFSFSVTLATENPSMFHSPKIQRRNNYSHFKAAMSTGKNVK